MIDITIDVECDHWYNETDDACAARFTIPESLLNIDVQSVWQRVRKQLEGRGWSWTRSAGGRIKVECPRHREGA